VETTNPAVERQLRLSPAELEKIATDPTIITKLGRKISAIQLLDIHRRLADPNVSLKLRMEFAEFAAKLGDVMPKPNAAVNGGAPLFTLTIVPPSGATAAPMVITAQQPEEQPPQIIDAPAAEIPAEE
jgi:hypothetical protein